MTAVEKRLRFAFAAFSLLLMVWLVACKDEADTAVSPTTPSVSVYAEGLLNPIGMAALPDGTLFVAEEGTGNNDDSAGVSLITPDRQIGRFISGLHSGRDSGDLSGAPLVAISPDGRTLYTANFGAGHLWTLPLDPDNPPHLGTPYMPDDLTPVMLPLNNVRLTNPFDMTFDADGVPVVSDASGNGVAKMNPDGTTRFIHRFAELTDPNNSKVKIDPVPTGITRIGHEYYVTLTGGCPYPAGSGQVVVIDESRSQYTAVSGLNMPIDVAVGDDGTIWVLEFARFTPDASCFTGSGYQDNTGRLSRLLPDGTLETVVENLSFPGAVLPMPDGSLFVSEVFNGRILHITFGEPETAETPPIGPVSLQTQPAYRDIRDVDAALQTAIQELGLKPNPGEPYREGDTPLARLGQQLFFDPILSGDKNISCATCHHPALAMADGRVLPIGTGGQGLGPQRDFVEEVTLAEEAPRRQDDPISNPFNGQFVPRNSPTVINAALYPVQFWDGRVQSYQPGSVVLTQEEEVNRLILTDALAAQALFPITSMHEMAGATLGSQAPMQIRTYLLERLAENPTYAAQFEAIFGRAQPEVTDVAAAIAAFERQFIFTNAPWDAYLQGDRSALTDQQKRGALLFFGVLNPAVNCVQCHSGDLFTDMAYHNILAPQLGPGKGNGENGREDWGRAGVTFDARDQYAFRTPSLRNVALTAPYFHSGAYATLAAAVRHHANIWEAASSYDPAAHVPPAFYSSYRPFNPARQWPTAAPELRNGMPMSDADVADLVAFLQALTDPAAVDLRAFVPEAVPSGLPLDPVPNAETVAGWLAADEGGETAVSDTTPESPAVTLSFVNAAQAVGLDFTHGAFRTAIYEDPAAMMGGGLCWLDVDNDGWLDLYVVNSYAEAEVDYWQAQGGLPENALFYNENGRFRDISAASGTNLSMRGNGCVAADFNLDGWMDIYVTADGANALLWNQGDGTFVEGAEAAGVLADEWSSAAAAADVNHDGLPDLFVAAYIDLADKVPSPVGAFPQDYFGQPDHLFLNQGIDPATGLAAFAEVTEMAGLTHEERGLGALFSDFDNDGDLDLYIANDGQPNRLYQWEPADNALGFRFVDMTDPAAVGDAGSGMGIAGGDWDGNGLLDMVVTNWEAEQNAIYRNVMDDVGGMAFRYSTFRIGLQGLGMDMTGWGVHFADFDLDGDEDLLIVNGRVPVTNLESDPELVRFYSNQLANGRPGLFREWTQLVGLADVGPLLARGSAAADFDNDGDLDVAVNTIAGQLALLQNEQSGGNWLEVAAAGFYPGVRVTAVLPDGRQLVREYHAGSSYAASEDTRLHFGLGEFTQVDQLIVRWPDGVEKTLKAVSANQVVVVSP